MTQPLTAPFPWFGGKSRAAPAVWHALGDVSNYVEPFGGSLAVLLARPANKWRKNKMLETVNDNDGMVVNFWRAVQDAPEEVAAAAEWPVFEADLHARHESLLRTRAVLVEKLIKDPFYYDPVAAGWWAWGVSVWITPAFCAGDADKPPSRSMPRSLVGGMATLTLAQKIDVLTQLAERLRGVRVLCGDWKRVLGTGTINTMSGETGIFLDPPYITGSDLYAVDGAGIAKEVHAWALANGDHPDYRIVVAGYDGEVDLPWPSLKWKARKGFSTTGVSKRERLWFSPRCFYPGRAFQAAHPETRDGE